MNDSLHVWWGKNKAGQLLLNEAGEFSFSYSPDWLRNPDALPISLRMPLAPEPYPDSICRLFFSNLLPEGNVRAMIARKLQVSESNDFALLKGIGGDCAGALSLISENETIADAGSYQLLKSKELNEMIQGMATNPLLVYKDKLRLSLAGAQQKLPVYFNDGKIYLPRGAFASSHILKPKAAGFDSIVENEAFCMALAKRAGLNVPESQILAGKEPVFNIARYDRAVNEKGKIVRLHQEDFCQALGYRFSQKYETEGGPGLKHCFSLLAEHSTIPILDKKALLEWVAFNILIGNCDAHAKNLSMMIHKENYRLAPFYDLVSTSVYPQLAYKMAMKIGGEYRPEWIRKDHWEKLALESGIGWKAILNICGEMSKTLPPIAAKFSKEFIKAHGGAVVINKIVKHISAQAKRMLAALNYE